MKYKDVTGQKFGRLMVERYTGSANGAAMFLCSCECGNTCVTSGCRLRRGETRSCGCLQREKALEQARRLSAVHKPPSRKTHGGGKTRLYRTWCGMKKRCYNENYDHYDRYGGRGIKICEEWLNSFETFRDWALANGYRDDLTIDRIDNDGDYEPSNCRFCSKTEQVRNRSNSVKITFNGETRTLKEWCEEMGISYKTAHAMVHRGLPFQDVALHFGIEL